MGAVNSALITSTIIPVCIPLDGVGTALITSYLTCHATDNVWISAQ